MRLRPHARRFRAFLATGGRIVALAAVVLLAAGTVTWAAWTRVVPFVASHEYFRLRSIRVACDNPAVAADSLAEMGGLYDDSSLWDIDPPTVEQQLLQQSWVRHVHVARSFPWKVSVDVARRRAVAATIADGKVYLVDDNGALFQEVEPERTPDLTYLTGWEDAATQAERASRLRALLAILSETGRRSYKLSELHMDDGGVLWMFPTDLRASVRLGTPSRAPAALDRLAIALKELAPVADQIRSVDADYNDRVVVRGADEKFPALVTARLDRQPEHPVAATPASPSGSTTSTAAPGPAPSSREARRRNG